MNGDHVRLVFRQVWSTTRSSRKARCRRVSRMPDGCGDRDERFNVGESARAVSERAARVERAESRGRDKCMLLDGDSTGSRVGVASQRAVYQALKVPEKYHTEYKFWRTAATMGQKRERVWVTRIADGRWSCSASERRYDGVDEVFWRFRYAGQARSAVQPAWKPYCESKLLAPWHTPSREACPVQAHVGVGEGSRSLSKINRTPGQASGCCEVWFLTMRRVWRRRPNLKFQVVKCSQAALRVAQVAEAVLF